MAKKPEFPEYKALAEGLYDHDGEECTRMCDGLFHEGTFLGDDLCFAALENEDPHEIHEDPEEVAAIEAQLDDYYGDRWMCHDFDPCDAIEEGSHLGG